MELEEEEDDDLLEAGQLSLAMTGTQSVQGDVAAYTSRHTQRGLQHHDFASIVMTAAAGSPRPIGQRSPRANSSRHIWQSEVASEVDNAPLENDRQQQPQGSTNGNRRSMYRGNDEQLDGENQEIEDVLDAQGGGAYRIEMRRRLRTRQAHEYVLNRDGRDDMEEITMENPRQLGRPRLTDSLENDEVHDRAYSQRDPNEYRIDVRDGSESDEDLSDINRTFGRK
jgi:hypothetical protein